MMRKLRLAFVFAAHVVALWGFISSQAYAAQDTTIIIDNAPIRSDPSTSAKSIDYLPIGSEMRISSYPLPGGWYKVRATTGEYGWINVFYLSIGKASSADQLISNPE